MKHGRFPKLIKLFSFIFILSCMTMLLATPVFAASKGTINLDANNGTQVSRSKTVTISKKAISSSGWSQRGDCVYNDVTYFVVSLTDAEGNLVTVTDPAELLSMCNFTIDGKTISDEMYSELANSLGSIRNGTYDGIYKDQLPKVIPVVQAYNNRYFHLLLYSSGKKTGTSTVKINAEGMKTSTIKVKIINPVNTIALATSKKDASGITLRTGKKMQLKASYSTKYSGETISLKGKGVTWKLYRYDTYKNGYTLIQDTNFAKRSDRITSSDIKISKSGKISVSAACPEGLYLAYATGKDPLKPTSSFEFKVENAPVLAKKFVYFTNVGNADFSAAVANAIPNTGLKVKSLENTNDYYFIGLEYTPISGYNPPAFLLPLNTAGCTVSSYNEASDVEISGKYYKVYTVKPTATGNKTLKFRATDGSGKTASFKLKVYAPDSSEGILPSGSTCAEDIIVKDGAPQPMLNCSNPWFKNYTNATSDILRFNVYVETDYDTDNDGKRDLVKVLMQVPRSAAEGKYKAGVIFDPTPYYAGNPANTDKLMELTSEKSGEVSLADLKREATPRTAAGSIDVLSLALTNDEKYENKGTDWYYTLNSNNYTSTTTWGQQNTRAFDYFLVRGYAFATTSGLGTTGSEGFEICGSEVETLAQCAVVEWLHGDPNRHAYTDKTHCIEVSASDFSNGKIAATGCSYGGTIPFSMAVTGVEGLETIIPEAGIASWYDYTNSAGAAKYSTLEYSYWLSAYCAGRIYDSNWIDPATGKVDEEKHDNFVSEYVEYLRRLQRNEAALGGQYWMEGNDFYVERDATTRAENIKCSALIVHGTNDFNVPTKNAMLMYNAFTSQGRDARLLLTQDAHGIPNSVNIMGVTGFPGGIVFEELENRWLAHYLYGIENGMPDALAAVTAQSNLNQHTFSTYDAWDGTRGTIFETEDESSTSGDNTTTISMNSVVIDTGLDYSLKAPVSENYVENEILFESDRSVFEEDLLPDSDELISLLTEDEDATGRIIDGKVLSPAEWNDADYLDTYKNGGAITFDITDSAHSKTGRHEIIGTPLISFSASPKADYSANSRLMLTALLIDYVDEGQFSAQMKTDFSTSAGYGPSYSIGGGLADKKYVIFATSPTRAKVITKGYCVLNMPDATFKGEKDNMIIDIEKDAYYNYNIYLSPTAYTVAEGHKLALQLITYDPVQVNPNDYYIYEEGVRTRLPMDFGFDVDMSTVNIEIPEK